MNPFRPHKTRKSDVYLVAGTLLLIAGLVAWAFIA